MRNRIAFSLLLPIPFLFTGCASIVSGTSQTISVVTPPTSGATCKLSNNKGAWYVNQTPDSVTVHRSYGDLSATCRKSGFSTATKTFKSSTKGMAFGNVLFGGLIGGGVDVADGAAYSYPETIVVPMHRR